MSRKCKFDPEWKKALSCMHPNDARKVREIIINYQETGIVPSTIETKFEIILLLVQPIIDRRRRAAARARIRRQQQKEKRTANRQQTQSTSVPTPGAEHEQNRNVITQKCPQAPAHRMPSLVRPAIKVPSHNKLIAQGFQHRKTQWPFKQRVEIKPPNH